ncbi:MAG TPA: hypothetical protein VMV86_02625 [Methanosarcinales archaeon]|nr:hypothetical protein [Methanosarcinales archaeon]
MKSRDRRQMPLSCKYWWKGMAKSNYRKHKGRKRNQLLEEAIAELHERNKDEQLEKTEV